MLAKRVTACCAFFALGGAAAQPAPDLARTFGQLPSISMPRLSPDGRHLALQMTRDGLPAILSIDLAENDRGTWLVRTERGGFKLTDCQWAKNDRLLCVAHYTAMRDLRPYEEYGVFLLDADGGEIKEILRNQPWIRLVNRLTDDPENIAIELRETVDRGYPLGEVLGFWRALYLLNVYTGSIELLAPAKPPIWRWQLSDDGQTAVGFGGNEIWSWRRQSAEFTAIGSPPAPVADLVGLDREARSALLLADDRGKRALFAVPLDGQPAHLLARDDTYDVEGFDALPGLTHRAGRATVLTETPEHRWLETGMANSQRTLDGLITGAKAYVETASQDLKRSVVRFENDRVSPYYVLFDSAAQPRVLGAAYPGVDNAKLVPVRMVRVPMRDGLAIDVFITEPPVRPDGPVRAVVMPHGGPEVRDSRGFDYTAQFLAASGYVVLQPNFRGSAGYGREFLEAGRRGWGTTMHDDITDTARWAIGEKLADAGHVCILGMSYGGYAALLGVAKEPDLYACAVSVAGPSDLGELLFDFEKTRDDFEQEIQRNRIGWDRDELIAQSPFKLADGIKAPVLLIHGKLDTRVEMDQSQRMARALRRNDAPVKLILQDNGDHFLRDEQQRIETLREIGRFLAEHL
jgi:dipeptidyl aminopeptidase/acylaminoacyl peptidase